MQIDIERQFRKTRGIPLTPLVDVLCCLLIFFMLSTSFVRTEAMELSLPSQAGSTFTGKTVHIFISNNGETFLEEKSLGENDLRHALRQRLFDDPDSHVLVLVADKVSVQMLVRVLDRVYLSGGRNIAVDKVEDRLMDIHRSKQGSKEINMIPLINVIFLMLIFFMIGGSIEKFEVVHIELPVADSGKTLDEGQVVITLGTHEEIILNEDLLDNVNQLIPRLKELLGDKANRVITINADASIPAASLIDIMEHVRAAGGRNLSIATHSLVP